MLDKFRNRIFKFVNSHKDYLLITAVAPGLYSLLYYYTSNFPYVNSWQQLGYFVFNLIVIPIVSFFCFKFFNT